MEDSKPDGKRIILKKRERREHSPDLNSEPVLGVESAETASESDSSSKYFYEGEVFDQFHRPLKVSGGAERLQQLRDTPLEPVAPSPRESASRREALAHERQSVAEALSHQIFQLAQRDRESQLDIYLSAFNVALAERTPQEARDILNRAHEFFTEHYYSKIRERGERPEIYAQVVKRVGHEHAERLQRVVFGLDVEETAKKLWELRHGAHSDKSSRILDVLLDFTESQVLTLREEYLRLPYKELAKQLHATLNQTTTEAPTASRRTIGKSEVTEHKRASAFRSRDQLRALRYLLLGRGAQEMVLVKRFYIELGDQSLPDSELAIETQIKKRFSPAEAQRLLHLLQGWTPQSEAEEIHTIIMGRTVRGILDDLHCDPRDVVEREWTPGLGPFLRRFKRARLLQVSSTVTARASTAFQELRERVAALSYSQFLATNKVLSEYYGYDLDPNIFPSLALFDPRQRAIQMYERLNASFDIFEALQPMEFLEPRECLAVQKAYQCLFGASLKDALETRLKTLGVVIAPSEFERVFGRYVDGEARWPLNGDLLSSYSNSAGTGGAWDPDFIVRSDDEERARQIAQLLEHEGTTVEVDRLIREALFGLPLEALHAVERAFYDLTEPHTPLREALSEVMSPDAYSVLMLSFNGFDVSVIPQRLHADPMYAVALREMSVHEILFVRDTFKRLFFTDLVEHVVHAGESSGDTERTLEALGVLMKPEIFSVRRLLGMMRRETPAEVDSLRSVCSGVAVKVMGFERAYDMIFPSLRVHLKHAAARMSLSISSFVELILLLEGVDPEIITRVQEGFDSHDIQLVQEILRSHKTTQTIIEECYDLLYPDRTFRHMLKELSVDPDLVNEALLHLEGYCSFSVARELHQLVTTLKGADLAAAVMRIITPQTGEQANERIPQDINWMDEMIHQIGLSYRRQFGESLVNACRNQGVDSTSLEDLVGRLYGLEIASSARELFNLIKCAREGVAPPEGAEARISSYLESRGPKYRERVMSAYQSYWAHHPGCSGLLDDLTKHFKDSGSKRKLLAMFLSTASDRKAAPPPIPDIQ